MADSSKFISVVIPTRNRKNTLEKCLEAFCHQTYPDDCYEIVVVDDGSTDGTRELLEESSKSMANLGHFLQTQGGPAKARNLGIRHAKGPIVLFTGDDCIPDTKLLQEHNRIHREVVNVAVLGHIDWHPDLEVTPFMEYVGRTHQFSFPIIERERLNVSFGYFYTSNISIAKDMLIEAGLFDEEFSDAVYEDAEMGYRLWRSGLRIIYNRRALTHHYHPLTLEDYIQRQIKLGKAAVTFYKKHPEVSDDLKMEDAVSPQIRENFYDSVMRYYHAVGIQIGLKKLKGEGLDETKFMVPLDDILERWRGKISDRLLNNLKKERREKNEIIARLEGKNKSLSQELKIYREFADKVKATFAYRFYKSLKTLLGKS